MKVALWARDGSALEFTNGRLENRGSWFRCDATLVVDSHATTVELGMITPHRNMWAKSFDQLAANEWTDPQSWESEHGEVELTFRRGEGDVVLADVLMRWPPTYDEERRATLALTTDDLERAARALRTFLRLER